MAKNIISLLLLLISAFLHFRHGWGAFQQATAEQTRMMSSLGISPSVMPYFGVLSLVLGLTLFFPKTFFWSNLINAVIIVLIMVLSLKAGDYKMALIEIPFLAMPLILIGLKYPFKNFYI